MASSPMRLASCPSRSLSLVYKVPKTYLVCKRLTPSVSMLRKKWQWYLLTMLRQTVKTSAIRRLVDTCDTRYRAGFVTNVQKGDVPTRYQSLARYRATYVVSPPISLRRIDRYDGQRVTYHYRSHKSERVE